MIVLKDNGNVYFAYDVVDYYIGYMYDSSFSDANNSLSWKVKNTKNCIMMNSNVRDCDLLRYEKPFKGSKITYHKMVSEVEPKIRKILGEYGRCDLEHRGYNEKTIIAQDDKAFAINSDGSIGEIEFFDVFGMLSETIRAYLYATQNSDLSPEERIINAEKCAGKAEIKRVFPLMIMDTKSMKIKVVNG